MTDTYLAAVVQLTSTSDVEASWESASTLIRRAAARGAALVATPENTNYLGPHEEKVRLAEPVDGPTCRRFGALAAELRIHLLLGSFNERVEAADGTAGEPGAGRGRPLPLEGGNRGAAKRQRPVRRAPERSEDVGEGDGEIGVGQKAGEGVGWEAAAGSARGGRCHNTSVLFGPDGAVLATYRKIHLFDVAVPPDVFFQESATVVPGTDPVVAGTPLGRLGLTICYDLRFPELYRELSRRGAELLTVPSAFTLTTGKDHWEPLLRARAIENQCWLLAPAQHGRHDDGGLRHSWGHAMIVDPWGHVVALASDGPGIALAEIDLARLRRVREHLPALAHRRLQAG